MLLTMYETKIFDGFEICFLRFYDLKTFSNPLALGSSDRRVERILKTINLQPSMPSGLNHAGLSTNYLSKQGEFGALMFVRGSTAISMQESPEFDRRFLLGG